jgi:uncharacterized membrane protein/YHS domain-containing protein
LLRARTVPLAGRLQEFAVGTLLAALVLLSPVRACGAEKPLNPKCPVLTDENSDPEIHTDYQGKRVWFCCPKCRRDFLAGPQKYVANLPQFAVPPAKASGETVTPAAPGPEKAHAHEHEHATPPPAASFASKLVSFLGLFHPAIVHFPIALILVAGLAELLLLATGRPLFASATRFILPLAALGAVAAASLGWAAAAAAYYPPDPAQVLEQHRWLGTTVVLFSVAAAILRERVERTPATAGLRWSYRGVLLLAVLLVSATGHFGGELVYGIGHYAWPS